MSKVTVTQASLVVLEDVVKTYHMGEVEVTALNHTDLVLDRGECVVILGPSGSGKTTLLGLAAAPLGIWLGLKTADQLYAQLSSEAFTLTAYIKPSSVVVILVGLLLVMLLSEIPPVLRILRLNLAQATKVME